MTSNIRNFRLAAGIHTAADIFTAYAVPASHSAIVKFIGLFNQTIETGTTSVMLYEPTTQATIAIVSQSLTANQTGVWSGWIVLNAADTIAISAGTTRLHFWIAGALLPYAGIVPTQAAAAQPPPPTQPSASETLPSVMVPLPPTIYLPPNQNPPYVASV